MLTVEVKKPKPESGMPLWVFLSLILPPLLFVFIGAVARGSLYAWIALSSAVVLAPFVWLSWLRWRAFHPQAEEVDAATEARVNAAFARRRHSR